MGKVEFLPSCAGFAPGLIHGKVPHCSQDVYINRPAKSALCGSHRQPIINPRLSKGKHSLSKSQFKGTKQPSKKSRNEPHKTGCIAALLLSSFRFLCLGVHGFRSFYRRVFRVAKGACWTRGLFFSFVGLLSFQRKEQAGAPSVTHFRTRRKFRVSRSRKPLRLWHGEKNSPRHYTILFNLLDNIIQSRTGNEPGWGSCRESLKLEGFSGARRRGADQ